MSRFSLDSFKNSLNRYTREKIIEHQAFRLIHPANINKCSNPTNSSNCYNNGGRFNFPYHYPALYLGFSYIVANLEFIHNLKPLSTVFRDSDFRTTICIPMTITGNFVDLKDPIFGFDSNHPEYLIPTHEWKKAIHINKPAITHKIGRIIIDEGFDGVIYHSYAAYERNFIGLYEDEIKCCCIFMSTDDLSIPKNPGCKVVCTDKSLLDFLKRTD